jgi:hypothetical protein
MDGRSAQWLETLCTVAVKGLLASHEEINNDVTLIVEKRNPAALGVHKTRKQKTFT